MPVNDRVLLDGIIDDRVAERFPSVARGEVFEFFSFEQVLKYADISADDIRSGWVDSRDDGGIDGFYVFVNDHLLLDPRAFHWPRGSARITTWIISCKHHETFKQVTVDKLLATLSELLDFSKASAELKGSYCQELLSARDKLIFAYKTVATRIVEFQVRMVYASRGDTLALGDAVAARARQTEATVRALFSASDVVFQFIGASELVAMSRKARRYSLELPFISHFAQGERYVLLCHLRDYCGFVVDEDQNLRRYLFDSNVRDFMGLNVVNEDIRTTLLSERSPDFWWLNNGVTILTTKAIITGNSIVLDDVQIVNGLQTTESIARYFRDGNADPGQRSVLVKVIKTEDPAIRDAIIRATNNQTAVAQQSLHATDKIQRDIEAMLLRHQWYYDRRANYYLNLGHPPDRIVSPLYLAAGAVGVFLRSPGRASSLRQKFMRTQEAYNRVFSESVDLEAWPKLVALLKFVDGVLTEIRERHAGVAQERFLKRWRYIVGLLVVARRLGTFAFTSKQVAALDVECWDEAFVHEVWRLVVEESRNSKVREGRSVAHDLIQRICARAALEYNLAATQSVNLMGYKTYRLQSEFIDAVDYALPDQPWERGVHRAVATRLGCGAGKVRAAIEELIRLGRRQSQHDGLVHDSNDSGAL